MSNPNPTQVMKTYVKLYTKGGGKLTFRYNGNSPIKLQDFHKSCCQNWGLICMPNDRKYSVKTDGPVGHFYRYDESYPIPGYDVYEIYLYEPGEDCEEYCSKFRVDRIVIETREGNKVTKICDITPDSKISGYDGETNSILLRTDWRTMESQKL